MHRILLICLIVPVLVGFSGLGRGDLELENRTRASFPDFPTTLTGLPSFFAGFDAFVSDNIGFRDQMVAAKQSYDRFVNGYSNSKVLAGQNGWMYYNFSGVIERNDGREFNEYRVGNIVNYVLEAQKIAEENGAQFLAMPVPSKHSVYRANLPGWAQVNEVSQTEQREIAERLIETGMNVTDVYDIFQRYDLVETPLYFKRDTHWNNFGAYIAFHDAMTRFSLQDGIPAPDKILINYYDGEYYGVLDQFLGLTAALESEPLPALNLDAFSQITETTVREFDDHVSMDSFEVVYGSDKPSLLVVGDSFTYGFFREYWGAVFGEIRWSHHSYGAYDRGGIEEFEPDYVIFEFVDWELPAWHAFEGLEQSQ